MTLLHTSGNSFLNYGVYALAKNIASTTTTIKQEGYQNHQATFANNDCGTFYPIGFFEKEPNKINSFWSGKEPKGKFFLRLIITAKHHIQPPSTRILIFLNPRLFWSGLKKIPRPQVSVFKPIHWTPLGILAAEHASQSARNLNLALPFTVKNWARFFYVTW